MSDFDKIENLEEKNRLIEEELVKLNNVKEDAEDKEITLNTKVINFQFYMTIILIIVVIINVIVILMKIFK